MAPSLFLITTVELNLIALMDAVSTTASKPSGEGESLQIGAIATFLGVVRGENLGRRGLQLEYEVYEPLAVRAFARIGAEVAERWPAIRLGIHHRIGRLEVGQASVAIATCSPHRVDAFAACRYSIERIKQIAPIWKHEFFEGGDVWIEGATADPYDEEAKAEAFRRACA